MTSLESNLPLVSKIEDLEADIAFLDWALCRPQTFELDETAMVGLTNFMLRLKADCAAIGEMATAQAA